MPGAAVNGRWASKVCSSCRITACPTEQLFPIMTPAADDGIILHGGFPVKGGILSDLSAALCNGVICKDGVARQLHFSQAMASGPQSTRGNSGRGYRSFPHSHRRRIPAQDILGQIVTARCDAGLGCRDGRVGDFVFLHPGITRSRLGGRGLFPQHTEIMPSATPAGGDPGRIFLGSDTLLFGSHGARYNSEDVAVLPNQLHLRAQSSFPVSPVSLKTAS